MNHTRKPGTSNPNQPKKKGQKEPNRIIPFRNRPPTEAPLPFRNNEDRWLGLVTAYYAAEPGGGLGFLLGQHFLTYSQNAYALGFRDGIAFRRTGVLIPTKSGSCEGPTSHQLMPRQLKGSPGSPGKEIWTDSRFIESWLRV